MITKVINVNLHQPIYERLTAKQGDIASRYLLFHLLDGDKPFDLSNKTVRVYAIKPDKTEIFNDLTINDASKGYCTLELTSQCLASAGVVKMELYISQSGKVLTSIPFELEVIACINTVNSVTSTNEFSALEVALSSLQDYDNLRSEIVQARKGYGTVGKRLDEIESEVHLGCVLRPTTDINHPWRLFEDDAHKSKGIANVTYNSDGTITLKFDKTYKQIISFNAFNDEMMKIYGLEAGVSTTLSNAKIFLISRLIVGTPLTFKQSDQSVNIGKKGHIASATWVSGTGVVVKFKNVPKQTPNSVQVTVTNALNLTATCSITGDREITIKFYKKDGTLVTDISGDWACMIDANFTGLVDFNCTSVYDSELLGSMALMYSVHVGQ